METGKTAWRYDQRAALMALLATGGDLMFGGDLAGVLRAFDAATGKVLWETSLGAQVTGHPVTFAVDGKQYVAVSTGRSNMTGGLDAAHARRRAGREPEQAVRVRPAGLGLCSVGVP